MLPVLHIQLLGGFHLRSEGTTIPTLDHPRLQALLAYLVLHRDRPHARQHLAFLLWPDSTESQARTNLRTLLHRLRQAFPDANQWLHVDAQTVQWRPSAACTLDVADFAHALAHADQAEQAGDAVTLRAALTQAVDLYRGDLLPGWYDDWVLLERERLRQAVLVTLERLTLLLEQDRAYATAIEYAQRLLRHDPLHEAAYQHLMRLHALSGDRASALRVYQTCATVLERELGVEPSPATREGYEQLLHLEVAAAPVIHPALPAPDRRRHNLPLALTSFIGRTREIAEVSRLLATARLLTLTGAGGCGKTRLAQAAAAELVAIYPDGVWLIELAPLSDAVLVPQAIATVLGVREAPQRPLMATLVDALQTKKLLLLLDNCEHLIDACAQLAQTLLSACPQLHILATSREALNLAGETSWLVPSLALPDRMPFGRPAPTLEELAQVEAVQLFVERATAALPSFALTQANAPAVAQICQRLDGIPLAIELAAARIKVLAVEQISARLDDCFRLLTVGSRTALPRHQTLRAAIDWSYVLLSDFERAMFGRLSVFAGGWILEAAEAVCVGKDVVADEVLELLAHLVDKSLVVVETPDGTTRYRLLEPIRQYAEEKLREAEEVETIRRQHANYYLMFAEMAELEFRRPREAVSLGRLQIEYDNLRAALHWMVIGRDAELSIRLAGALVYFWEMRSLLTEGRAWLTQVLALAGPSATPHTRAYAKALQGSGVLAFSQGDHFTARSLFEKSLAIYREIDDRRGIGWTLIFFAGMLNDTGDPVAALPLLRESLAICRDLGDQLGIGWALARLGHWELFQGNQAAARPLLEESMAICRAAGDRRGIAMALHLLAMAVAGQGDVSKAIALEEELLPILRELQNMRSMSYTLGTLGFCHMERGEYTKAHRLYTEALTLQQEIGDKWGISTLLWCCAVLSAAQSHFERAMRFAGASAALFQNTGSILGIMLPKAHHLLMRASTALGAEEQARAYSEGQAMTLEQAIVYAVAEPTTLHEATADQPATRTEPQV